MSVLAANASISALIDLIQIPFQIQIYHLIAAKGCTFPRFRFMQEFHPRNNLFVAKNQKYN